MTFSQAKTGWRVLPPDDRGSVCGRFRPRCKAIVATAMLGLCPAANPWPVYSVRGLMYFYKRALTRHVHTALREEVWSKEKRNESERVL